MAELSLFKEGFHPHSVLFCGDSTFYVQNENGHCLVKIIADLNTLNEMDTVSLSS